MATVLPRNRGFKNPRTPSIKRYSVPFRYAPKATHDATSPQQRTLSARIIHYRFISEGSRTLSYEARRSPSATNDICKHPKYVSIRNMPDGYTKPSNCYHTTTKNKILSNKMLGFCGFCVGIREVSGGLGIKKRAGQLAVVRLLGGSDLLSHFRSTIGAVRFNFSVRNGKRWNPHAITTLVSFHRSFLCVRCVKVKVIAGSAKRSRAVSCRLKRRLCLFSRPGLRRAFL